MAVGDSPVLLGGGPVDNVVWTATSALKMTIGQGERRLTCSEYARRHQAIVASGQPSGITPRSPTRNDAAEYSRCSSHMRSANKDVAAERGSGKLR